jgi:cytosine/adenosine deaminase-related metal-dependent hydrolase
LTPKPTAANQRSDQALLVRGELVLTMEPEQPIIEDGAVAVQGADIVAVGEYAELARRFPSAPTLGSEHHWVLPGLVNAHNHGAMVSGSFRQGILDLPLERWLMRLYNSRLLDGQMSIAYLNTLHQNAQLISSGVTCTADFYYGDGSEPYLGAEHGLQGYQESGIRIALFLAAVNQPSVDNGDLEVFLDLLPKELAERAQALGPIQYNITEQDYLEGWSRVHRDFHESGGPINIMLGPDGPVRCTPDFLAAIKQKAKEYDTAIQMHLLETKYQMLYGRREKGQSLVKYLHGLAFLSPKVSFAHGIWLSPEDADLIADAGASVVHNPSSNLRLFDGIAPVQKMLSSGVNVGLGTDNMGFSDDNDLLDEMRLAALLQRVPGVRGHALSGQQALNMATMGSARALGLSDHIGSLKVGKRADLVTLSTTRMLAPFMNPLNDVREIIWRRARREDVCDVLINGRIVKKNGELTTINTARVREGLREWYEQLWAERGEEEQTIHEILAQVDPFVVNFFEEYERDDQGRTDYRYNAWSSREE